MAYYRSIPYIDLKVDAKEKHQHEDDDDFGTSDEDEYDARQNPNPRHPPPHCIRFWSDRFYLNATTDEERDGIKPLSPSSTCHCGSASPPPLFPRETFIKSLHLKAAIIGTFGWSPTYVAENFPFLLQSTPTLLLHGQKGMTCSDYWKNLVKKMEHKHKDDEETDYEHSSDEYGGGATLEETFSEDSEGQDASPNNAGGFKRLADTSLDTAKRFSQSSTFQMNYIQTNWNKKKHGRKDSSQYVSRSENTLNRNSDSTKDAVKEKPERETRKGVHHPKFMLLLETSGNLIVLVTTANMTPTKTVEGTWVQRFYPVRHHHHHSQTNNIDFGVVLQDFMTKISDAAEDSNSANEFMTQHFPCPLSELSGSFEFHKAQVHLVPIIPGDYESPVTVKMESEKDKKKSNKRNRQSLSPKQRPRFYYGHQRVRYIMKKLARDTPRISKKTEDKSKSDRLVLQPTSLGGDWTRENFAALIRGYMGYPADDVERDDDWVCGQTDIVWPSDKTIVSLGGTSPLDRFIKNDMTVVNETVQAGGNFVFNSSRAFNQCEHDVLSRMCLFDASTPSQVAPKVPHFKSVARVFSNRKALKLSNVNDDADAHFSWFLLTSACLSHGAQGVPVGKATTTKQVNANNDFHPEVFGYRNFELGVLFTSRVYDPDNEKSKRRQQRLPPRMYCFHPVECKCRGQNSSQNTDNATLIHLPVPYYVRPESYFETNGEDDDEEHLFDAMKENPYFHQIVPDSRCVGNMLLTPFGRRLVEMSDEQQQGRMKRQRTAETRNIDD